MAERVISIEVGKYITRAVEMDYKVKKPRLYSYFSFETPKGVIEDGAINADENFYTILKREMRRYRIRTNKVIFTINAKRMTEREVLLPYVKEKKIAGLLMARSSKYFPIDLSRYRLGYRILGKIENGKKRNYRLLVVAVPDLLIKSYEALAQACELNILAFDYVGNSIQRIMEKMVESAERTMMLKIEEEATIITILKKGQVDLQQTCFYGIGEAVTARRDSQARTDDLSFLDALQDMKNTTYVLPQLEKKDLSIVLDKDSNVFDLQLKVTETLQKLVVNTKTIINEYLLQNPSVKFNQVFVCGSGAVCSGLEQLLSNELGLSVTQNWKTSGIRFGEGMGEAIHLLPEYATCIGAAIRPMAFQFGKHADWKVSDGSGTLALAKFILGVCVVGCVGVIGYCEFQARSLEEEKVNYKNRINELYSVKQMQKDSISTKQELENCKKIYSQIETPVDGILEFIAELETNMPSDIRINHFVANSNGISMNLTTSSKESLTEVLIQLRSLKNIDRVSCAELTQTIDEWGNMPVTTTIVCSYAAVSARN